MCVLWDRNASINTTKNSNPSYTSRKDHKSIYKYGITNGIGNILRNKQIKSTGENTNKRDNNVNSMGNAKYNTRNSSGYGVLYLSLCLLLLMQEGVRCCPSDTDSDLLANNTHIRAIFKEYADGDVITYQGIQKLLQRLGLTLKEDAAPPGEGHGGGGAGVDPHVTHGHNPEGERGSHSSLPVGTNSASSFGHGGDDRGGDDDKNKNDRTQGGHHSQADQDSSSKPLSMLSPSSPSVTEASDGEASHEDHDHHSSHDDHDHSHDANHNSHGGSETWPVVSKTGDHQHPEETNCGSVSGALSQMSLNASSSMQPTELYESCPALLHYLLDQSPRCALGYLTIDTRVRVEPVLDRTSGEPHIPAQPYRIARWVGGFISMLLIGCISLACTMLLPALRKSRHYDQANHFLLSLAVGTLAGDALIHLLPHAISMGGESQFTHSDHNDHDLHLHEHRGSQHFMQALYGFTALMGIIIFLFLERLHNIRSGSKENTHSHGGSAHQRPQDRNSSLPRNASDTAIDGIGLPPSQMIGKKLSEHSKEHSFNNTIDGDPARCFGGCPPEIKPQSGGDANDNTNTADNTLGPNDNNSSGGVAANCLTSASTASTMRKDGANSLRRGGGGTNPLYRDGTNSLHHDAANTLLSKESGYSLRRDGVLPVRRQPLKDLSSGGGGGSAADLAERERLMSPLSVTEKLEVKAEKSAGQQAAAKEDSGSVNIVLQEYHVSHHGHSHHGHAHVSGRKDSLRMMILMGEGLHILMDGIAIGAAFATSLTGGIATAIAVLCHELPHKVGDFALLFDMGMTRRTAMQVVLLMWLISVGGMIVGELIGSITSAAPWIYSLTAGIFLHLALVDLLSEVSVKRAESCSAAGQLMLQLCGMLVGAGIMLIIALYEHDLHNMLAKLF